MVSKRTENVTLPPLDRETIQKRLNHHEAGGSLSDLDRKILVLLMDTPLKEPNPCVERFMLYQATIDIYNSSLTGRVPAHFGVQMLQNQNKRRVYELLFNVLHRKLLNDCCC